ncbi:MAG: hypothetical protein V1913_02680 [Fibrobacterota bacterium]
MASKKDETILGIDLSERSLKLFQRNAHSNEADLVHVEPLTPSDFETEGYLTGVLKRLLSMYKGHLRARTVVLGLPSYMTFTRVLEVDPGLEDLTEQIGWEIEQQSFGRSGSQVFDYLELKTTPSVVPRDTDVQLERLTREAEDPAGSGDASDETVAPPAPETPVSTENRMARYLVTAVEEARLRFIEGALKKARFAPSVVDLDIYALINIFAHSYPEDTSEPVALVNMGTDTATVILTLDGQYIDHECIRSLDFISGGGALTHAIGRVEAAVRDQALQQNTLLKKIMICGEMLADPHMRETLVPAFNFTVEVLDPLKKIRVASEIAKQITHISPALAVAAGLTLRAQGEEGGA